MAGWLVVGACVVDSDEVLDSDGVGDLLGSNVAGVVAGVVSRRADSDEAEEVVGLVEFNEVKGGVDLVESAAVVTTEVGKMELFGAVVELSLALHCMPCRRVPNTMSVHEIAIFIQSV